MILNAGRGFQTRARVDAPRPGRANRFRDVRCIEPARDDHFARRAARERQSETLADVLDLLPRVRERLEQNAGSLSGGEQQMVAIARGMMARPKLLMFDEPSLGLAPIVVAQVFAVVDQIVKTGATVDFGAIIRGLAVDRISDMLENSWGIHRALIMAGGRRITEIAVMGNGAALCTPCGGCRQRLVEFARPDTPVHMGNAGGIRRTMTLAELTPLFFGPQNLGR